MTYPMNRRSFLAHAATGVAAGLAGVGGRLDAQPAPGATGDSLDALVKAERAAIVAGMAAQSVEGTAVCLLDHGRPVWVEGFGKTGGPDSVDVDSETIFSIQSTSKHFTAVGVLLAAQEGLLDLDVPIVRYLPRFKVSSRFEANPQDRITLRLLLCHRAGLTHEAPTGNNYEPQSPSFEAHVRSISDTWLRFPVGERYRYSNLGYDLAGFILHERTAMPYAQWLRRKLLEPLGMHDSTADPEVYTARRNRAVGHEEGYDTIPAVTPLVASGGVYASARDMAAYLAFHLDGGRVRGDALLDPDIWQEMHGFGLGGDYGLGVIRNEVRYGETPVRVLSHQGGGFGFGCVFVYCPAARLGWAAMFNRRASAPYRFGSKLIEGALTGRFGAAMPRLTAKAIAPIRPTAALRRELVGSYVGRNVTARIREEGDGLRFDEDTGGTHGPLLVNAPTAFFTAAPDGDLTGYQYVPAADGLPAHLECGKGEASLDYNEGPNDPPGPDLDTWARHLGTYTVDQWGKPAFDVKVERRNGYLFINGVRLVVEQEPGLFFTSDGEAVDFRKDVPRWRNLRLRRG
ncbi:serine hydrolase domain-containing protein [Marilutibacter chinensis]|uniref:Beta-lactamase family protein n=1 Tax=Marilutibacter chinensis TaxID=2912247 RepID=A0ABS9HRG2_9GAMM|nr:serine hydrolase domain-containing protein [Lysobacter chinensis]MCF7220745.1 beta-lactamase family protein [Lysobacter chinensis]